jgi:hypothetical protein
MSTQSSETQYHTALEKLSTFQKKFRGDAKKGVKMHLCAANILSNCANVFSIWVCFDTGKTQVFINKNLNMLTIEYEYK